MKTMWGGRPRLPRVSRPACPPTGCGGFSDRARVLQYPLFLCETVPSAGLERKYDCRVYKIRWLVFRLFFGYFWSKTQDPHLSKNRACESSHRGAGTQPNATYFSHDRTPALIVGRSPWTAADAVVGPSPTSSRQTPFEAIHAPVMLPCGEHLHELLPGQNRSRDVFHRQPGARPQDGLGRRAQPAGAARHPRDAAGRPGFRLSQHGRRLHRRIGQGGLRPAAGSQRRQTYGGGLRVPEYAGAAHHVARDQRGRPFPGLGAGAPEPAVDYERAPGVRGMDAEAVREIEGLGLRSVGQTIVLRGLPRRGNIMADDTRRSSAARAAASPRLHRASSQFADSPVCITGKW